MAVQWYYGLHAVQSILEQDVSRVLEIILQPGREDERIAQIRTLAARGGVHVRLPKSVTYADGI